MIRRSRPGTELVDVLSQRDATTSPSAPTARSPSGAGARRGDPRSHRRRQSAATERSTMASVTRPAARQGFGATAGPEGRRPRDPRRRASRCSSGRAGAASRRCCARSPASRRPTRGTIRFGGRDVTRARAARSRHRDGVPELRALSAPHGAREPRVRAQAAQGRAGGDRRSASTRRAAMLGLEPLLDRLPEAALGRPAPARRDGPRDRAAARRSSSSTSRSRTSTRRCAAQVRVEHPQAARSARGDERLRHPRSGRGDDARRRIFVLNKGVRRAGRARRSRCIARPATRFVARFLGTPGDELPRRAGSSARRRAGSRAARRGARRSPIDAARFGGALARRPRGHRRRSPARRARSSTREGGAPFEVSIVEALGAESYAHGTSPARPSSPASRPATPVKKGDRSTSRFAEMHLFDKPSGVSLRAP